MRERLEWEYKDGHRAWWLIKAWKSDEVPAMLGDPLDDSVDWIWTYEISRDDDIIYGDSLRGQYDEPPHVEEIFVEYLDYIIRVHAGMAKHGVERIPQNVNQLPG